MRTWKHWLAGLGLSIASVATALAQGTWTRPPANECPTEEQRVTLAAQLTGIRPLDNSKPQECGGDPCNVVVVEVAPPQQGFPRCIASIEHGILNVGQRLRPTIFWRLESRSGCLPSTCTFDSDTGIDILRDPWPPDMYAWRFKSNLLASWTNHNTRRVNRSDPADVRDNAILYEPHVWWRARDTDPWQACCPIDPRIVNDGY